MRTATAPQLVALLLCVLGTGCAGRARLEFTPLHFKSIDPPPPHVTRLEFQHCYWWTDEDGTVWIAMEKKFAPWFNPRLQFEVQVSLALEKLPAGKARNYRIGGRELRARVKFGIWESRFASRAGIVALYRESGQRLRGSLRVQTSRVSSQLLGGWGEPTNYLMQGSFLAVENRQRGRAFAEITESQGWERSAPERSADAEEPEKHAENADAPGATGAAFPG